MTTPTQVSETLKDRFTKLEMQLTDQRQFFADVLPQNCNYEKFVGIIKTAIFKSPELLDADRTSFVNSCRFAAQDGLLPDGRESALVIYNTKQKDGSYVKMVQYMPMVAGVLKKIRNSGELSTFSAHVVYEKDEFEYCLGDEEHITHKPAISDRGKPICVYAIVKTKDGAIYREVMSKEEIESIRALSKSKDGTAWKDHWSEMAKKTVIRRLSKRLPMSSDLERVIKTDDETFEFSNQLENMPVPQINVIENLNKQILDIGDAPEIKDNNHN